MYLVQPEKFKNSKILTFSIHSLKLHKSNLNPSEKCKPKLISKTPPKPEQHQKDQIPLNIQTFESQFKALDQKGKHPKP